MTVRQVESLGSVDGENNQSHTFFRDIKMKMLLILSLLVAACGNKYDECIEKEKAQYRERNPKASYSQIASRQSDFEMMCSRLKGK